MRHLRWGAAGQILLMEGLLLLRALPLGQQLPQLLQRGPHLRAWGIANTVQ
jgi:hypothetical protein